MTKKWSAKFMVMMIVASMLFTGFKIYDKSIVAGDPLPLKRGKPVDLAQINFQQVNLDKLFGSLAYVKHYLLGDENKKYLKDKPLVIAPYVLFNITEQRIVDRYAKRESYIIRKGEMYADTVAVDRSVPLIGMKDPDLRVLGYWGDKEILFNRIYTSSTKKNKLIRLRLESNKIPGVNENTYQKLISLLKARYKGSQVKVDPQDNRPSSYQFRISDRVIQLSFIKDEGNSYITVIISFLNPDTRGLLLQFGH